MASLTTRDGRPKLWLNLSPRATLPEQQSSHHPQVLWDDWHLGSEETLFLTFPLLNLTARFFLGPLKTEHAKHALPSGSLLAVWRGAAMFYH